MLRRTEFAEKITTRGVFQIWHCNVASHVCTMWSAVVCATANVRHSVEM